MPTVLSSRIMPRTTLNLDATVLRELKQRGEREGKSLGDLASELLARSLHEEPAHTTRPLAFHTQEMRARIDLEDRDAVQRRLDHGE